jgi:aryl-alcohol dehydrogenase-like predicted oxidoreductase
LETIKISPLKISASRICLGTWAIGGWMWGGSDEADSLKAIRSALDSGINMIDTAPVYGFGRAEEIVGKAIKKYGNREKIILATKAGLDWSNNKISRDSSPTRLQKELEDSLKRLQTDYIDIYQIHWPDVKTPLAQTAETMLNFLKQGKIRAIGVSNFSPAQMQQFQKIAPIHTSQPPYNLFERDIEKAILPYTEKEKIVTLAYGALCRGLLSGKMQSDITFQGDDIRNIDPKFQAPQFQNYLQAVQALDHFAQTHYKKNVLALAIRWILDKGHTIALWGARRPEQLQAIDDVFGWSLDTNAMQEVDRILQKYIKQPVGAEFMAPPT